MAFTSATMISFFAVPVAAGPCLCIFDIDRTLTGKQGELDQCPNNVVKASMHQEPSWIDDHAYEGGTLTLSEVGHLVENTFCAQCHIGTTSAGDGGGDGSGEQAELYKHLSIGQSDLPEQWSYGCDSVSSPLVVTCTDGQKQTAVAGIQAWYGANRGVTIADEDIYMFDDRASNIEPFKKTNYNARQISCTARDPMHNNEIGLCGATVAELVADKGVYLCPLAPAHVEAPDPAPAPAPIGSCFVGQFVACPSNVFCMGNECCPDGSTCPSADATYSDCPWPKTMDCTDGSLLV